MSFRYVRQYDCDVCQDLGIVRITHHVKDDFESLMKCACGNKSEMNLKIPEWDNGLGGAFKRDICPLEWFKPKDLNGIFNESFWERVEFFKNKKRKAEAHWKSVGF